MQLEDEIIYPLFEKKTAEAKDAMLELHEQHENLVRLLTDLSCVIKTKNIEHFIESLVPLHKIMNEHNSYEEEVFQRLGSDSLLMHRDKVMQQLSTLQAKEGYQIKEWTF
jgi:hemerythrin